MKILERKTNLEGTAVELNDNGVITYEVTLPGKDVKVIAESTFKRNYKKINDEVAATEVADGGNEMEEQVIIVEENTEEVVENKPEVVEAKTEKIEIVLTEEEIAEVNKAVENLKNIIKVLPVNKAIIEKSSRSSKVSLPDTEISLMLEYKNSLMENIAEELKKELEGEVEIEFINQQKRPNPAAFKARGVKATDANGEEKTFKTRNDAMIWITKEFEDGKLDKKPTYYQVKKALESNGEYAGYKWEEIDPSEVVVEA